LTSFVAAGELKELGEYLAVQNLFDFNAVNDFTTVKEFPAAGRKHADAIELQDRVGYGTMKRGQSSLVSHECRFAVDPAVLATPMRMRRSFRL
jgi:hypothetical protein